MDGRKLWRRLNQGWAGVLFSIFLGVVFATFFYYVVLATALQTSLPVVAVVSSSMQHDSPEFTHYGWLEKNLNYHNRTFVESWSVPNGFSIGDMPIVQGANRYDAGDVVVYRVEGQPAPIIHRIIKVNDDGTFQTKGDNNLSQLSYELSVKKEQIHGRVIFIIPKLGYVKVLASKILGI